MLHQVGGYQAHWQLLPPQHTLAPSLTPLNRTLASRELYRLVLFVLRSTVCGSPRLSEELLLSALNLLSLALHHLLSALETARIAGAGRGSGEASAAGGASVGGTVGGSNSRRVSWATSTSEAILLAAMVVGALRGGAKGERHEYGSTGGEAPPQNDRDAHTHADACTHPHTCAHHLKPGARCTVAALVHPHVSHLTQACFCLYDSSGSLALPLHMCVPCGQTPAMFSCTSMDWDFSRPVVIQHRCTPLSRC